MEMNMLKLMLLHVGLLNMVIIPAAEAKIINVVNKCIQCGGTNVCLPEHRVCDGIVDCNGPNDGLDEYIGESGRICACEEHEFQCNYYDCVDKTVLCDGFADCPGGQDESHNLDDESYTIHQSSSVKCPCLDDDFRCDAGNCIPNNFACDLVEDCPGGDDENPGFCDPTCSGTEFTCDDGSCIPMSLVCDYDNDCTSGEDEIDCIVICEDGYVHDENGDCVVNHIVTCEDNSMTVIFNTILLPPLATVYLGDPACTPTSTYVLSGITYYEFSVGFDVTSCGITATEEDGYIIYSTVVIAGTMDVLYVKCMMEKTKTVTVQIMANPCVVPVTIEGDVTVNLGMTWYDDDTYDSLQPDNQSVNACDDTKIYIGIEVMGTPVPDLVVFIRNCTITGTATGETEVQAFEVVEDYGCPVEEYGMEIDDASTNTNVLFCFNPYGIVNDNGITVFDLTCDVVLCLPGQPGCTPICDGIHGKFKKSTHFTNGNTNPITGGPFILNECT